MLANIQQFRGSIKSWQIPSSLSLVMAPTLQLQAGYHHSIFSVVLVRP